MNRLPRAGNGRLVALDRDGTVIQERPYLSKPQDVVLLPRAAEGLRILQREGFRLVLVSNQSGVGRGYFTMEDVERVNQRLFDLLAAQGVWLDGFYICPHTPWAGCRCRKPATGLLEQAAQAWGISPDEAFVVGDKECDIEMGLRAGASTFLVRTGWGLVTEQRGAVRPHFVVEDLPDAASLILAHVRREGIPV